MPTLEPRIQVTPSPRTGPLLRELAKLTGKPAATIVREMLDEAAPALEGMVEALRVIKQRPQAAQAALSRFAAQAHREIAQATLDLDQAMKAKPGRKPGRKSGRGAAKPR